MINVGIAGLGFMGMIHYLAYQRLRGVRVVAMCEKDPVKLSGDWRAVKGNFGPPGEMMDLSGIERYSELDAMLANPNIDMVDVCLPPAAHAPAVIAALDAGKHVFCEKPICLRESDAEQMVSTAQRTGRLLGIGHVLPFFPEYHFAYEAIRDGRYGAMLGGHFKRIISDPLWLPDFYNADRTGGPMLDLHIHDAHYIRLTCGMPTAVQTMGRMRGDVLEHFSTQFSFADPRMVVTAVSGVIYQQGRSFTHAFEIHLEKATLLFDFAVIGDQALTPMPLTVLEASGKVERPQLGSGDPIEGFVAELTEATKAVESGVPSPLLRGELARDALILCQRQTCSVIEQRKLPV